jgi:hypothetical protein
MQAAIEVTGVRRRFGPTVALDGMSFTVAPGQVTGLIGPNGAGKTTTMRAILLSLGVATAVRDSAVAIGAVLGLLYLFPILAQVTGSAGAARHLQQIGPMTAGLEIQAGTGLRHLPIGPWAGLGVAAAWAAAALLAGAMVLRLRDA